MIFPCTSCGACCRRVESIVEDMGTPPEGHPFHFPHKWDESGACEKLVDNKCSIYEDRPLICSVEKVIEAFGVDEKQFHIDLIELCNKNMDEDNMPQEFRIK